MCQDQQAFSNVEIKILDQDLDKNRDFRVYETVETLSRPTFETCRGKSRPPSLVFGQCQFQFKSKFLTKTKLV